jgi:hypothetical protein
VPPASSALSAISFSTSFGSKWTGTPAFWLRVASERNSVQSSRSNVNSGDFVRSGRLAEAAAESGRIFNPSGSTVIGSSCTRLGARREVMRQPPVLVRRAAP